ncbi:MAG: enoyl-CoA hydratase/isomerase family protein [Gemmatimonadota bacterium]
MSFLLTSLHNGVFTLTLNRPDKRNALSTPLLEELARQLTSADLDAAVRVVAIRGAGKDFCAGADLEELLASADRTPEQNEAAALIMGNVFIQMRRLGKPVVAVVHGRVLAGGAGLATACDLVLAPESCQFGYPEIQRGFVPAMVMTMLKRLVGEKVAFDLAATGRVLGAREAAGVGLISRVFGDAEFESGAGIVLEGLAAASPTALAFTKKQFYQLDGLAFEDGIRMGARVNALSRATPDFRTAIAAFLKK